MTKSRNVKITLCFLLLGLAVTSVSTSARTWCENAGHSCHIILDGVTHHMLEVI